MGWASGSSVMDIIIAALSYHIKDDTVRYQIYKLLIEALEGNDWDTQNECLGYDTMFDVALDSIHPDWEVLEKEVEDNG